MNKVVFKYSSLVIGLVIGLAVVSCNKKTELGSGPYFNAPETAVNFFGKKPIPIDGKAGDRVTYEVTGLEKLDNYKFFINQVEAQVVEATDSLITVIIPEETSSGPAAVLTQDGQYFYGPTLKIIGRVAADPAFRVGNGTNGPIYDAYYNGAGNGMFLLGGSFTDFDSRSAGQKINGIVKIAADGTFLEYGAGEGAFGGFVNTILPFGGQYYLGGVMSTYGNHNVGGIARVNDDCSLDTTAVELINPDPELHPENDKDTVPSLNAYMSGNVVRIFSTSGNKLIALGNMSQFYSYYYEGSQKNNYYVDRTEMYNFIRFDGQGVMDSSFNYDPSIGHGTRNLNGNIADGVQLPDGKIIFVGSFTRFGSENAPKIGALTGDGKLDPAFAAAVGSGADGDIYRITYNATTGKLLITGEFTHYDGHPANGIAMLNADGSFDPGFSLREYVGGAPNFAGQLNNGLILVSGAFSRYDDVVRQGFMILNPDGSLAVGYNNTGAFAGSINGIVETGLHSVVLYGYITLFDNVKVGNIVKIAFD